jgi:mutator protein MutT
MSRAFPAQPVVSVGAVVLDGPRVLLVKRGQPPLMGRWSLPGGVVELGEELTDALCREVREETGLDVSVGPLVEALDRIEREPDGRVAYHYVILDYLCRPAAGEVRPGSDAEDAGWVAVADLGTYQVTTATARVVQKALALARTDL